MTLNEPTKQEQGGQARDADFGDQDIVVGFLQDVQPIAGQPHDDDEQHAAGDAEAPWRVENAVDHTPHVPPQAEVATVPQPAPARNLKDPVMADQPQPTTLDHAAAMLDYLRKLDPAVGHEMARAAIGASMVYLRERFGEVHAFEIADDLACRIMAEAVLMRAAPSTAGLH